VKPTPVLIWADLPIELKVTDPERPEHSKPPAPARWRCAARSRGDTFIALRNRIPPGGGYRCPFRWTKDGLCWRHYKDASPAVRRRAAELAGLAVTGSRGA
jgi:hypothetical protein